MVNKSNKQHLLMSNISKNFGIKQVLYDVNFEVFHNEIHALVGENGAGKSTLMSILFGLIKPTSGEIFLNNKKIKISSPIDANKFKIGMVHQHFKLINTFSVFENITLNHETTKLGFLLQNEDKKKVLALCKDFNIELDLNKKVFNLSVIEKQQVEILKLLYLEPEILIFDEPTAVLTPQQIKKFLEYLLFLKNKGKTIIIISHKLNEIKSIADRVTVLRLGKKIDTLEMSKTSISAISNLMVGEDYKESFSTKEPSHSSNNSFVLKSHAITIQNSNINDSKNTFFNQSLNFELHPFEIIAFVGVENNGQEDIFNILVGLEKPLGGKFYFKNTNTNLLLMNTKKRNDSGISFIAGDRHKYSIALDFSLWENMILSNYYIKPNSYYSFINFNYIKSQTQKVVNKYDVRGVDSSNNIIRGLSGGNQQKFVLGREIEKNNSLICVMQPTRGLDILATQNIHKLLIEERNKGKGILLISYDLDEVFALADKVIVFYKNQFTSPINISEIDRRQIGVLMLGGELNYDSI